jgi:hypothetical protein
VVQVDVQYRITEDVGLSADATMLLTLFLRRPRGEGGGKHALFDNFQQFQVEVPHSKLIH